MMIYESVFKMWILVIATLLLSLVLVGCTERTSNVPTHLEPTKQDIAKVKNSLRYFKKDGRCYAVSFWMMNSPIGYGHAITCIPCDENVPSELEKINAKAQAKP